MQRCFTQSEIDRILGGGADEGLMVEWLQHLESCPSCHAAVLESRKLASAAASLRDGITTIPACLDYEEIAAYLDGSLPEEDRSAVEMHLQECSDCKGDLEYLREMESHAALIPQRTLIPGLNIRRRTLSLRAIFGFGFTTAGVAAALLVVFLHPPAPNQSSHVASKPPVAIDVVTPTVKEKPVTAVQPSNKPVIMSSPTNKPAQFRPKPPTVILKDGPYVVAAKNGTDTRVNRKSSGKEVDLPRDIKIAVMTKLRTGRVQERPIVLAMANTILRGSNQNADLAPSELKPNQTNVLDANPILAWNAPGRVSRFKVQIFMMDGQKVWEGSTNSKQLSLSMPLKQGETYLWRVGSYVGEEVFYSKATAIKVLSSKESSAIHSTVQKYKDSHLIKGVTYERYGLYDNALVEFKALVRENPKSKLAKKLLAGLAQ
jgi:hypothetical protein